MTRPFLLVVSKAQPSFNRVLGVLSPSLRRGKGQSVSAAHINISSLNHHEILFLMLSFIIFITS
ncbi:hypothetical protein BN137_1803 [Cronobacter condimenti 1330]|uniref:Uncharacterized protein n=1 Tax=Cronobacter condimenti 1330 TaxID=1073999 RepID=K8A0S7_9ENTR|nr:hypothetical protein AFK62_09855 [Cronobacter condimenti 1330]CCJ72435.1 hypothetical protein BN137_1803 [Cronobacter condimenti 1330]